MFFKAGKDRTLQDSVAPKFIAQATCSVMRLAGQESFTQFRKHI